MKSVLTFRFDDDHDALEAVRITVKTVTIKGVGEHARMTQEAIEAWRAETGLNQDKEPSNGLQGQEGGEGEEGQVTAPRTPQPQDNVTYNAYTRWATLSAATSNVQLVKRSKKRTASLDDTENTDEWPWEQSSMNALGWDKPQGIIDLPVDLFNAWEEAAQRVNPGVFGRPLASNQGKKKTQVGVISVT